MKNCHYDVIYTLSKIRMRIIINVYINTQQNIWLTVTCYSTCLNHLKSVWSFWIFHLNLINWLSLNDFFFFNIKIDSETFRTERFNPEVLRLRSFCKENYLEFLKNSDIAILSQRLDARIQHTSLVHFLFRLGENPQDMDIAWNFGWWEWKRQEK